MTNRFRPIRRRTDCTKNELARWVAMFGLTLCILIFPMNRTLAQMSGAIDPSGGWKNNLGVLSLMLAGDTLSFSYSSVFGAAAHICDGAGVAGLVGDGEYHYVDDQGTVAFQVSENEIHMAVVTGVPSFCGAEWPGDTFTREGYEPLEHGRVTSPKTRFYVVMPSPPLERKAYLISGDEVQVAPAHHEGSDDYVLARYKGPKSTTVGLLKKDTVEIIE